MDLDRAVCVAKFEGYGQGVFYVSVDFASQRALSGSVDNTLKLWAWDPAVSLAMLPGYEDCVSGVSVDPAPTQAIIRTCQPHQDVRSMPQKWVSTAASHNQKVLHRTNV